MTADFTHLRNQVIPSYLSADDDDPYALIFVVNDSKNDKGELPPEDHILAAAMHALTDLLLSQDEDTQTRISAWLAGRICKIVKRAKNAAWDKTTQMDIPYSESSFNDAKVRVFAPMQLSHQPPALKKLQVTGLQATVKHTLAVAEDMLIDAKLDMTTGKLIAQVGHAVQLFIMDADENKVTAWLEAGQRVAVIPTDTMPSQDNVDVAVRDAGFTEVPAGSLTATALYR
jgi:peptidyl-tRNA hydrolase